MNYLNLGLVPTFIIFNQIGIYKSIILLRNTINKKNLAAYFKKFCLFLKHRITFSSISFITITFVKNVGDLLCEIFSL